MKKFTLQLIAVTLAIFAIAFYAQADVRLIQSSQVGVLDISANTNLGVTATGLTLSGDNVILTAGYEIATSARLALHDTAYSWGNHATAGYLASATIDTFAELNNFVTDAILLKSGGSLTSAYHCRWDGTGIDCDRVEDASGNCGTSAVCMGGHTHTLTLTGDSGTSQTLTNSGASGGDSLNVRGGTGLTAVAGATDTITISADTGYIIPLTASTTEWNTAYNWGNHALAGYAVAGGAFHDGFSDFVANEHIDWTTDQGATNIHSGNYTDTNTTYTAGGTLLDLTSTTFSLKEGTLTDTKLCLYTSANGLVCNTTNNSTNWDTAYSFIASYNATTTHANLSNLPSLTRPFSFTGISTSTQDVNGNFLVAGATSTVELIRVPYPMTISEIGYDVTTGTAGLNIGDCTNYMGFKSVTTTFASSTVSTNNTYVQGETLCAAVNLSSASTLLFITGLMTTD